MCGLGGGKKVRVGEENYSIYAKVSRSPDKEQSPLQTQDSNNQFNV